jgi:hypothetical protein
VSAENTQSRPYRGYRIVAQQFTDAWSGVVQGPDGAIVGNIDGASAQEVTIRGMGLVDELLSTR